MAKIFAGEIVAEGLLGAEVASGVGIPLAFVSAGVMSMIYGIKHHKHKKEDEKH
jgi:hypothetical protein